jgi:hypothetical protein
LHTYALKARIENSYERKPLQTKRQKQTRNLKFDRSKNKQLKINNQHRKHQSHKNKAGRKIKQTQKAARSGAKQHKLKLQNNEHISTPVANEIYVVGLCPLVQLNVHIIHWHT